MPSRFVSIVLGIGIVAISGCGSSVSVNQPSTAQQTSPSAATEATTQPSTSATQTATQPTPPASATWHFTWTHSGGYRYSATLSLAPPEHVEANAVSPCKAEPQTAAQVLGTLVLTNDTSNFPGKPYLDFVSSSVLFVGNEACYGEGEGGNIAYQPDHELAAGASSTNKVALVLPNYYSPEHPSGGGLGNYQIDAQTLEEVNGGEGTEPVKISGPAVESAGEISQFSLGPLVP